MKHFTAVYFPEQWSITNGGVPVCHFVGESNNKEFAEFVAKALNAGQQSAQADKCPECGAADGYHKTGCNLWLWEPSPRRKA